MPTAFWASGGVGQHFIHFAAELGHAMLAVYRGSDDSTGTGPSP
jgi:NADPH:quinone reductase-like Zn-dependent oxidoreductase